jgi:asparagine synthase (glutamine-hydrolysing)
MLHYFDRASMAHSLEVRVPFLDHRLVEFCATLPSSLRVRGRTTKYLLKEAARSVLPDAVVDKPKVGFFNRSVDTWLGDQRSTVVGDALLSHTPHYADLIDARAVRRLFEAHVSGRDTTHSRLLLSVLMLELWLQAFDSTGASRAQRVLLAA